jgi:peptidoglycan/xylan/chitin deacetylase (PgdA/CDA1 family)
VDSNDAGGAKTAEEVYENVINGIKKRPVSVVLQHDIRQFSVDAVEKIIIWGLDNGYTFLPLDETSPICQHTLAN